MAIALRLAAFPLTDNKHGDAPMRALIAERMNLDRQAAADPRTFCQFGPLHPALMRPFLAVDPDAPRSSRYLSLLAGIAVFLPFMRLARRIGDAIAWTELGMPSGVRRGRVREPAQGSRIGEAGLATLALAVSPLHIQASTTASSEALYLLLIVCCLERLLFALADGSRGAFVVAGLCASLAAITRYDAWLALPITAVAAAVFARRGRPWRAVLPGLSLFALAAAALPLGWLAWSAHVTSDPFSFAHSITDDHAALAAAVNARFGPVLARGRQAGIWALSFAAAMGLPMAVAAAAALRRFRSFDAEMKIVVLAALAPPAVYFAQGMMLSTFEPLARFALIPGTLLLPLGARALLARWTPSRARVAIAGSAALLSAAVMAVAWAPAGRIWAGAESLGPVTRLDAEDRQLADYLRAHRAPRERVFIEPLAYNDILITHAARVPAALSVTLAITKTPERTVAETLARTGASWLAVHDAWAAHFGSDWPAGSLHFGRWRLFHAGGRD